MAKNPKKLLTYAKKHGELIGATFKPVEVMRSRSTMTKKAKC
jgi:hypothetical protein